MDNNNLQSVTVYLIKYYDSIKDMEDNIIVFMDDNMDIISNMPEQIFNYLYPDRDYFENEINIITGEKLYTTKRENLKYPFLEILGDNYLITSNFRKYNDGMLSIKNKVKEIIEESNN